MKREEDYNKGVKKVGVWIRKNFIFISMKSLFISRLNRPNQTLSSPRKDSLKKMSKILSILSLKLL